MDPKVFDAIEKSKQTSSWIINMIDDLDINNNDRTKVAEGCFSLVLEHQVAIWNSLMKNLHGSAFALARCLFESYIRGLWFQRCATDDDINLFLTKDKINKTENKSKTMQDMITDIEISLDLNKEKILSELFKNNWAQLNSFTHSGMFQIARRYSKRGVEPNYPNDEVIRLCRFANRIAIFAGMASASNSPNNTMQIQKEFYDKLTESN